MCSFETHPQSLFDYIILKTTVSWVQPQFGIWYLDPVGCKKLRERSPNLARNAGNHLSWVATVEKFSFILFPSVLIHVVQCKLVPNISCTSVYGFKKVFKQLNCWKYQSLKYCNVPGCSVTRTKIWTHPSCFPKLLWQHIKISSA